MNLGLPFMNQILPTQHGARKIRVSYRTLTTAKSFSVSFSTQQANGVLVEDNFRPFINVSSGHEHNTWRKM